MSKKVIQLHFQYKDGRPNEFRCQTEIETTSDLKDFLAEANSFNKLPEGAIWEVVEEGSPKFFEMVTDNTVCLGGKESINRDG